MCVCVCVCVCVRKNWGKLRTVVAPRLQRTTGRLYLIFVFVFAFEGLFQVCCQMCFQSSKYLAKHFTLYSGYYSSFFELVSNSLVLGLHKSFIMNACAINPWINNKTGVVNFQIKIM